jgi:hypothetical protein
MMDKAKLINMDFPIEFVVFSINPNQISLQKGNAQSSRGTQQATGMGFSGSTNQQQQQSMPLKLVLKDVYVESAMCKVTADMMMAWMMPCGSPIQQAIKAALGLAPRTNLDRNSPTLLFQWGPPILGFVMQCKLTTLQIDFTRFSPLGTPTRFKIGQLQLDEVWDFSLYALTNPTSGGKPGRAAHMMTDGENLQGISQDRFGKPGYWRALAEANNIDDPIRVRAGDNVYLPPMDEVLTSPSGH